MFLLLEEVRVRNYKKYRIKIKGNSLIIISDETEELLNIIDLI